MADSSLSLNRLCVFCGSRPGARPAYVEAARALGALLAARGIGLVYGGGHVGMMGELADAVLDGGGEVFGVIPRFMVDKELAHPRATEMHVVETLHERKAKMAELCDAFAVLPGGYGTLDELFESLTWLQLGLHRRPIGLLDVDGFFEALVSHVDRAVEDGYIAPGHRSLLRVADTPAALLDVLAR